MFFKSFGPFCSLPTVQIRLRRRKKSLSVFITIRTLGHCIHMSIQLDRLNIPPISYPVQVVPPWLGRCYIYDMIYYTYFSCRAIKRYLLWFHFIVLIVLLPNIKGYRYQIIMAKKLKNYRT